MNTKISEQNLYYFSNRLEETIRNKKFFLHWSSVSAFNSYSNENKRSFYSFDIRKFIEREEEIDRLKSKVLLPFFILLD